MQSYLEEYPNCAKNREAKFLRAVNSVINQEYKDWELIIIADGCEKTYQIIERRYKEDDRISCLKIKKQDLWSGAPRDLGKITAKGNYCIYLDTDDYYGKNHLKIIDDNIGDNEWVCFNDFIIVNKKWHERVCNMHKIGMNGTSNVCFKRELNVSWSTYTGYAHDYFFNKQLVSNYKKNQKITTPEYYVCHLPPHNGGKGYDV